MTTPRPEAEDPYPDLDGFDARTPRPEALPYDTEDLTIARNQLRDYGKIMGTDNPERWLATLDAARAARPETDDDHYEGCPRCNHCACAGVTRKATP